MILAALVPLSGHAVYLLLIQLALLLMVARVGAEFAKRIGLPAVVGELAAGILLGPTVFGHYAPGAFAVLFPHESAQFHLLDTVGTLGMVLLLLLTGLETDLRLLRNLGRAAFVASAMGMVVPFASGFGLGLWMPDVYLAQPGQRMLFSAFLATAMSISAMPVIAKILMDLDLTRRNIGLVILSAGVVDDTAGWLILSVIAGAASSGGAVHLSSLAWTVGYMVAYLLAMGLVIYPLMRLFLRAATQFRSQDADLVLIVVVTLLSAAATEKIGVHAVFGAFIAGTVFRQVPRLNPETVHKLESFVFAILAPVFFGIVGLKVNLWTLGGGKMLGLVLGVACLGKLVGCTLGGLWGGMRFWEALSIGFAMNARGAMELVVATIGLSLGILNPQMFSMIVVVAIVTSFMAPLALRLTMRRVRMTDEEARRILAEETKGAFDPAKLRVLLPTAGGPNALEAARVAFPLVSHSENPLEVVYIDAQSTWWQRWFGWLRPSEAGRGLHQHLDAIRALAGTVGAPRTRQVASNSVAGTILSEASQGHDLIMIGASQRGPTLGGRVLEDVVEHAPCHVAIVKAAQRGEQYRKLLVPIDGGTASRVAAEFAVRYAEAVGAELTLAVLSEKRPQALAYADEDVPTSPLHTAAGIAREVARADSGRHKSPRGAGPSVPPPPIEQTLEEELARISRVFSSTSLKPTVLHLDYDPSSAAVSAEAAAGQYDLVVLGAENRAVRHRLFFGYENQRLIQNSSIALVIVVPNIARLR